MSKALFDTIERYSNFNVSFHCRLLDKPAFAWGEVFIDVNFLGYEKRHTLSYVIYDNYDAFIQSEQYKEAKKALITELVNAYQYTILANFVDDLNKAKAKVQL